MTRTPNERRLRQLVHDDRRREIEDQFRRLGPVAVYGALLGYARRQRKRNGEPFKDGWASFAFEEIFGTRPQWKHRGEPVEIEGYLIEEWVSLRPKRQYRIKQEKPAPLVDLVKAEEVEKAKAVVDERGFVPGTLMTPEDFEYEWH